MTIGILEIMPFGHFTLVESISEIFASDENNHVFVFINAAGEKVLSPIFKDRKNVSLITRKEDESLDSFFRRVNSFNTDRLYITTLEKWFKDFYLFKFHGQINLIIHNVDVWSRFDLIYNLSNFLFSGFKANVIYNFKKYVVYPYWRKRLLRKVLSSGGKLVVLSGVIKEELSRYVPAGNLEVIPFSVFNEKTVDNSGNNRLLRICIPGMVSAVRRDYYSVFDVLESESDFFRDRVELVLLGKILNNEQGESVVKRADELISQGLKIKYFGQEFIPFHVFEDEFSRSDIVLGNMNVFLENVKSVYGKTKETGFTFTLIRFAKPGICISGYNLMEELKSSVLFYNGPEELKGILKDLLLKEGMLRELKDRARKNSLLFSPKAVYRQLTSSPD